MSYIPSSFSSLAPASTEAWPIDAARSAPWTPTRQLDTEYRIAFQSEQSRSQASHARSCPACRHVLFSDFVFLSIAIHCQHKQINEAFYVKSGFPASLEVRCVCCGPASPFGKNRPGCVGLPRGGTGLWCLPEAQPTSSAPTPPSWF